MRDNSFQSFLLVVGITISLFLILFFPPIKAIGQITAMPNNSGPTNGSNITNGNTTKSVSVNFPNNNSEVIGINRTSDTNETSSIQYSFAKLINEINGIRKSIDQSNNLPLTIVSGGLVAALGLFFGELGWRNLNNYLKKPRVKIDKESPSVTALIHLEIYRIDDPLLPNELAKFTVPYCVNRVIVRNDGMQAAKNCKASLKVDNKEEKICWSVPTERYKMTINAHSIEYLDVCAILTGKPEEYLGAARSNISKLRSYVNGLIKDVERMQYYDSHLKEISDMCKSADDIPSIISPTENGWQQQAKRNRKLEPDGKTFELVVTSENAKEVKESITISSKSVDSGKILTF